MRLPIPPVAGIGMAIGLLLAGSLSLSAQSLSALSTYNVITRGNFSTNSDVEGRVLVGGNFTGTNSSNIGNKLQGKVPSNDLVFRVQGNISGGNPINLNAGSLEVGGSTNGRIVNFNGGGSLKSNPNADYSAIINDLALASTVLDQLGPNSNVLMPADQPAAFKFVATPDSNGLAVFSINGSDLFSNSKVQQIELVANGATDILINVNGAQINWQYGNLVGLFTQAGWRDNIVWNFADATTINFGGHNMMGQVLAPNADITTSGVIDGSVVANSLTTTSEVHLPGYNGNIPLQSVPEPSFALLGGLGVLLLAGRRKRD